MNADDFYSADDTLAAVVGAFSDPEVDACYGDLVYVKEFPQVKPESNDNPLDYAIKYYPYIKIAMNSVYLVPRQRGNQHPKVCLCYPKLKKKEDARERFRRFYDPQLSTILSDKCEKNLFQLYNCR